MALGPVELIVIGFPGNEFTGEIAPALDELVSDGMVRIIDFVFLIKDAEGNTAEVEITEIPDAILSQYDPLVDDVSGLVSDEDLDALGEMLPLQSSALILLFEHTWATRFQQACINANGTLLMSERIPYEVIELAEAFATAE